MGFNRKWKPSKTACKEFAKTMDEIREFCINNNIHYSLSMDSYYFTLNSIPYRVSNHTVNSSDRGMYNPMTFEKVRESYHANDNPKTVYITASKTRLIEIYNDIKAGFSLDARGYRKEVKT